jgi:general secretion pathway protein L
MSSVIDLARNGLTAFLGWWLGELTASVPRQIRWVARQNRRRVVLQLNQQEIILLERVGERARVIGSVASDRPDRAGQLGALSQRLRRPRQPAILCLSGDLGLRKFVSLPLAAKDDLDQLLRFEMDRLTPFGADEVHFAYRIVDTDPQGRRITVELVVAPKTMVDQALETARMVGLVPARLELVGAHSDDPAPLDLLPHRSADRAGERRLVRALMLLAMLLTMVAVTIPLHQQRSKLADLNDQIAATRAKAEESRTLREQLDQLTQAAYFLLAEKARRPMATDVLAELTRLVPDDAYLSQLDLQEGQVELHGSAVTASDLIGLLGQSPLFSAPQFRSPVTQDDDDGAERFHLSIELAAEGD